MYVKDVKNWIEDSLEPFVWQRITIKLLTEFRQEGFYFHTIKDDKILNNRLLNLIDQSLYELYKEHLPAVFLKSREA